MTAIEYHSRHIITTQDEKYFVGHDENEAMYKLLISRGIAVPIVPTEAEMASECREFRADPKYRNEQIRKLASAYSWINDGVVLPDEEALNAASEMYANGLRHSVPSFVRGHIARHAMPEAIGQPMMNNYNSVRLKAPGSDEYVRVYTGCLRQNPLGIKKEYQFHCANVPGSDPGQVAILLDADRFADITQVAGIDGKVLDMLEQDIPKASVVQKRKLIESVKGLWEERYVDRARPCNTGYHGVKAEIFDLFNPFRLFENMFCNREVHPFLKFYKDKQLAEALSSIDLPEARMFGYLLEEFSHDHLLIEYYNKKAKMHSRKSKDKRLYEELRELHDKLQ